MGPLVRELPQYIKEDYYCPKWRGKLFDSFETPDRVVGAWPKTVELLHQKLSKLQVPTNKTVALKKL